ncbi:hypothetical protein [Streptomyces torulosus]|uniref:hypothetical protein n=1 Tax=Streptomyces torulosus TaxID=68276 RepID=UPI0006EB472A|nr:hypothetical protein [Streptomyces torulosus]
MSPRTARTVRGILGTVADAVRSVVAPATLVEQTETPVVVEAPDPAGLYTADEIPAVETIEAAAREYDRAADQARRADRSKRAAKKVLDKLPAGIYGTWRIFRTPSSRQTPDLAAITATYKRLGLGPVPMKACAPSLKVELVDVVPTAGEVLAGVAA